MFNTKVYIGFMVGKGLFHVYESNIENGFTFFIDKNLGSLIKQVVRAGKNTNTKFVVKVCRWSTCILD